MFAVSLCSYGDFVDSDRVLEKAMAVDIRMMMQLLLIHSDKAWEAGRSILLRSQRGTNRRGARVMKSVCGSRNVISLRISVLIFQFG